MEILNRYIQNLLSNFVFSNLPIIIALILLTSAPFLILQNEQDIANQIVGYAFYFLVAGILWKIIQHFMNNRFEKKNISPKKEEA
jgi:uncharacterized membrane protein